MTIPTSPPRKPYKSTQSPSQSKVIVPVSLHSSPAATLPLSLSHSHLTTAHLSVGVAVAVIGVVEIERHRILGSG